MNKIEAQIKNIRNDEEPYVGMPVSGMRRDMDMEHCYPYHHDHLAGMPIGMTYTPWQRWCETYEPVEALHRGTIFPELDLPFLAGGDC